MARFSVLQNSFKNGEISSKLAARSDSEEYKNALATMQNFVPIPEAGATRRPGTRLFYELGTTEERVFLPFIVDKETSYILSIQNNASLANMFKAYNVNIQGFYGKGGGLTAEISVGVVAAVTDLPSTLDLKGYNYTQVGDVMFIAHTSGKMPTFYVARTSTSTFTVGRYFEDTSAVLGPLFNNALIVRTPFRATNTTPTTMWSSAVAAGAACVVTASSAVFTPEDAGKYIRIKISGTVGVVKFTTLLGASSMNGTVVYLLGGTGIAGDATTDWSMSYTGQGYIPSTTTQGSYPLTVSYFKQRLVFGGIRGAEDSVLLTASNNAIYACTILDVAALAGYSSTASTDNPFIYTLGSNTINKVQWMTASSKLEIGTLGAEYVADTSLQLDGAVPFTLLEPNQQTANGGSDVMPVRIDKSTIYISRDGKDVREFLFNDSNGSFIAKKLTVLNSEIIYHGFDSGSRNDIKIVQMAFQNSSNTIWVINSLGYLFGLTIDTSSGMVAWHRHVIGGTDVFINSITCLPSESKDVLWLHVTRTVNSSTVAFIERLGDNFDYPLLSGSASDIDDDYPVFADAATTHAASLVPASFGTTWTINDAVGTADYLESTFETASDFFQYVQVRYKQGNKVITNLTNNGTYYVDVRKATTPSRLYMYASIADVTNDVKVDLDTVVTITGASLTITGFAGINCGYLEGESLKVLADGTLIEGITAGSAETILDGSAYTEVTFGLAYTSKLKTLKPNAGALFGSARGSLQRIHEIVVEFSNSYYAQYGRLDTELFNFNGMDKETKIDSVIMAKFPAGNQRGDQIIISSDEPLPLTVLGLSIRGQTNEA